MSRALIRCQNGTVADAKADVHDFVFIAGLCHPGLRFRAVLISHEHVDFGAERLLVELDCLLATSIKEQIRLDRHDSSFGTMGGNGRLLPIVERSNTKSTDDKNNFTSS